LLCFLGCRCHLCAAMSSCLVCGPFHSSTDVSTVEKGEPTAISAEAEVLQDIQTLRDMLTKKVHMMDTVKMHQNAMEVVMKELGEQVETARYALDDLSSKFQPSSDVEKASETLTMEVRDQAIDSPVRAGAPSSEQEAIAELEEEKAEKTSTESQQSDEQSGGQPGTLLSKLQSQIKTPVASMPSCKDGVYQFIKAWCRMLVDEKGRIGRWFEGIVCVVIIVNSVLIGVESEVALTRDTTSWARPLEVTFLTIYTVELAVRLVAKGQKCFYDRWFQFDFVLVVITLLGQIIAAFSEPVAQAMQQVLVLRALRLLRLVRAFKMVKQLRTIWRLVYGLITSGETMFSVLGLLVLVIYVFAVISLEAIARDADLLANEETKVIVETHFSSLYVAMVSLTQFVTSDSIAAIYLPLMKIKPFLGVYFMLLMIMVSISLMNLVTAVIVEGALEHARQDREEEQKLLTATAKDMLTEISGLFQGLDQDGNDMVTKEEVQRAEFEKKVVVPDYILDKASVDSMAELFSKLDVDESGILTREEFTEGLLNIFLLDIPVADMQIMKMVRLLRTGVRKIEDELAHLKRVVCESNMH